MQLHKLLDQEDPKCLYCKSNVDVSLRSSWIPYTALKTDTETILCLKCKEAFHIHSLQGSSGITEYTGFTFTCKRYRIFFSYIEDYFDISTKGGKHIMAIPSFPIDFSNKKIV